MLRGVFCIGLVWLCLSHGPKIGEDLGFGPSPAAACTNDAACDPVADTSAAWRKTALARLAAIRIELHDAAEHRAAP